jgi:lipopolysaccharide transport system permease protein
VISPIVSAGALSFVFGRVAHLSSGGVPYFPFTFAGMLAWTLFASSVTGAASSLVSNQTLFTRIYFPRLLLPLSAMAPVLLNTAISGGVMFVLLVAYKVGFSYRLLFLPIWLGLALLFSVGVSLMLSSWAVLRRDVQYITQAVIPLLLFVTPVAYSIVSVPAGKLRTIVLLNPMSSIVEGCRWSLVGQTPRPIVPTWAVAYSIAMALFALLAGLVVFARLEWKFADVV